ncbi:MAG: hypothetical protein CL677_01900 [Bdellovibrionaceae bacterium]|nr:hypothetical protein [Pseudobdellovibrionaceae bacterium]
MVMAFDRGQNVPMARFYGMAAGLRLPSGSAPFGLAVGSRSPALLAFESNQLCSKNATLHI